MRLTICTLCTMVAVVVSAGGAKATITVDGRGSGHGVGMSQYGAYGYALNGHHTADFILRHFYTGTTIGRVDAIRVRVRLKLVGAPILCGASRVTDARARAVELSEQGAYRFEQAGTAALRVIDTTTDGRLASLQAPLRVTGGRSVCLRGEAENGVTNGYYRGALKLIRTGPQVLVVNDIHVRHYLYGVVPSEMPSSWPIEAIKAQAIAARTYTMRNVRPDRDFDFFSNVTSQAYGGLGAETDQARAAVLSTDGRVVVYQGQVIDALYHSSSGGKTASNDEAFGTAPVPYLRSVVDAHDISPSHAWRETLPNAVAQARLGDLVQGTLASLRVTQRGPSGRALLVEVRDSAGSHVVPAAEVRRRLKLRSTWFDFV